MNEPIRKKSPRAPSISLEEALDRALKAYDRERLHPASADVIAQHIGYKNANNGAALSVIASLRYFGLLDRPKEGMLAVSKSVETYKFAPEESMKRTVLLNFLKTPTLYAELLETYKDNLPSEGSLRYALIQRGFSPTAAESALSAFLKSVQFADYFGANVKPMEEVSPQASMTNSVPEKSSPQPHVFPQTRFDDVDNESTEIDKIPVRLSGGRRAWLLIPDPFFQADRQRLKAQIDLILAQDDE